MKQLDALKLPTQRLGAIPLPSRIIYGYIQRVNKNKQIFWLLNDWPVATWVGIVFTIEKIQRKTDLGKPLSVSDSRTFSIQISQEIKMYK